MNLNPVQRINSEVRIDVTRKQQDFINSDCDEALYGGSVGGGKTYALLIFSAIRRMSIPGSRGIIFRRTYPEIERSVMPASRKIFTYFGAKYNEIKHHWKFPNGSIQEFGHCESEEDVYKYQGPEYQDICFDEATHFTFFQYNYLKTRLRTVIPGTKTMVRLATNPGGVGHCVRYGDVLTPSGWKPIQDFKIGDEVYSVDKSGKLFSTYVAQVHAENYSGILKQVSARGFTMECTPNHSVAKIYGHRFNGKCTRDGGESFSLVPFNDLPGQSTILRTVKWEGHDIDVFRLPTYTGGRKSNKNPSFINGDDFSEMMGWFLSEGHTNDRDKCFGISQLKNENILLIKNLLDRCSFDYSKTKHGFIVYDARWWNYLKQFGKCREKFIPPVLKNTSIRQLQILFDSLIRGDGHRKGISSGWYYTISKKLADDFCEIALKLGYIVYMRARQRENRDGVSYDISFKKCKSGGTEILTGRHKYKVNTTTKRKSDISDYFYDGPVYCIGIKDTHSFLLRQNGSVWVSGNSWVLENFIKPSELQNIWTDQETGKKFTFIQAKLTDNPYLMQGDPDYAKRMLELKKTSEKKYMALVEGRWDIYEGIYFSEWDKNLHVTRNIHKPSSGTLKAISLDWGFAEPASVLWHEITPLGRIFTYRELYETRKSPKELARMILEMSPDNEEFIYMRASPEIWGKKVETENGGEVIKDLMQIELGDRIIMEKANNARVAGWLKMREYLSLAPDGYPWWQISPVCKNLIRTLPAMIHEDRSGRNSEDIRPDGEDHCADAARYFLVSLKEVPRHPMSPYATDYEKIFGTKEPSMSRMIEPNGVIGKGGYGF